MPHMGLHGVAGPFLDVSSFSSCRRQEVTGPHGISLIEAYQGCRQLELASPIFSSLYLNTDMVPDNKEEEKAHEVVLVSDADSDLDLRDKDEALRLVGLQRTADFTEEYYKRLKRKLDWVIPPLCAAVYFTQYL